MFHRLTFTVLVLALGASSAAAQTGPLDLIPADAVAAIGLRSPDDLKTKGDQLVKDADLNFGLRPTEALDALINWLGVRQGLDFRGSFALSFLLNADEDPGLGNVINNFVLALAVQDRDQVAGHFGFAKGELTEGKILAVRKEQNALSIKFAVVRGQHILLANREAVLRQALQPRTLAGRMSPVQRETFGTADVLVLFNPRPIKNEWTQFRKMLDEELRRWDDPQDKKTVEQFSKSLDHFQFILAGARVDKGLGLQFLVALDEKAAEVKDLLGTLRAEEVAHLNGLPEGRMVAAQAHAGTGVRSGLFARTFVHYFLKHLLETTQITSAADRPTFLGVFADVWQRLKGSRVGVYLTRDESRLGLFSLVAILDTTDAAQFLAELRTLAKIGDGTLDLTKPEVRQELNIAKLVEDLGHARYPIRAAATTKLRLMGEPALPDLEKAVAAKKDPEQVQRARMLIADISAISAERRKELLAKDLPRFVRPTFAWVAKAETRVGQPIDIIHVRLKDADQPLAQLMKQHFGPDWDKMRVAVRGQQVVVLLGSEVELFEQALRNLPPTGTAGSARTPTKPGSPVARIQVSAQVAANLISGQPRRPLGTGLTSVILSVPESGVQIDLHIPTDDLRALNPNRR